jgi:hypothetical protein
MVEWNGGIAQHILNLSTIFSSGSTVHVGPWPQHYLQVTNKIQLNSSTFSQFAFVSLLLYRAMSLFLFLPDQEVQQNINSYSHMLCTLAGDHTGIQGCLP